MNSSDESGVSQGGVAFAKLMAAIKAGEFRPGDRLREVDIAERF